MFRPIAHITLVLLTALLTVACGDDDPVLPVPDPPVEISETFDGKLYRNGAVTHFFEAQRAGEISAQIIGLVPDTTIVGLSLGTGTGTVCQAAVSTEQAFNNSLLRGIATSAGPLCVRIYDPNGTLPPEAEIAYSVRVLHF